MSVFSVDFELGESLLAAASDSSSRAHLQSELQTCCRGGGVACQHARLCFLKCEGCRDKAAKGAGFPWFQREEEDVCGTNVCSFTL